MGYFYIPWHSFWGVARSDSRMRSLRWYIRKKDRSWEIRNYKFLAWSWGRNRFSLSMFQLSDLLVAKVGQGWEGGQEGRLSDKDSGRKNPGQGGQGGRIHLLWMGYTFSYEQVLHLFLLLHFFLWLWVGYRKINTNNRGETPDGNGEDMERPGEMEDEIWNCLIDIRNNLPLMEDIRI